MSDGRARRLILHIKCSAATSKKHIGAKIIWAVCLVILNLLPKISHAVDFEELLQRAELLDPQLASVGATKQGATEQFIATSRPPTPTINLGLNSQGYYSTLYGIPGIQQGPQKYGAGFASISIAQPLYNPLRQINIEEASLRLEFETSQIKVARNELAVRTLQTLINLMNATDALENSLEEIRVIKKIINLTSTKDSPLDGTTYQARLIQSEGQATLNRNILEQRNREFFRLIGMSPNSELKLSWRDGMDTNFLAVGIERFLEDADQNNLLIRQQQITLKLAEAGIRRTSRNTVPSIDLVVMGSSARGMPTYPSARTESASAGIQINIPLGDNGIGSIMKTEALMQESRVRNEIETTRRSVQQSISDAYYEYKNSQIQIETEIKMQQFKKKQEAKYKATDLTSDSITEKINNYEDDIVLLTSKREQRRLQRESLIQKTRIWASLGELDERQLRHISTYFISSPAGK
jgi:outer membrane protein